MCISTEWQKEHPVALPEMPPQEYAAWQALIQQRCGLFFSESRQHNLCRGIHERMRLCRMQSYRAYYNHIVSHPTGSAEWQALLDYLLNHDTGFFRHVPSYDALTGYVLPALLHDGRREKLIRMWSAGCSMGQEAYSLAMSFLDFTPPPSTLYLDRVGDDTRAGWQIKVIGSDISRRVLHKARLGQYKPHETRSLPDHYRQRYFTAIGDGHRRIYQIVPTVQSLVKFGYVNLQDPDSSPFLAGQSGGMDVIFCQNILIYFTLEDRLEIVQRLCQFLRPGGYLFLGPAEAMGLNLPGMRAVRLDDVMIYQRAL